MCSYIQTQRQIHGEQHTHGETQRHTHTRTAHPPYTSHKTPADTFVHAHNIHTQAHSDGCRTGTQRPSHTRVHPYKWSHLREDIHTWHRNTPVHTPHLNTLKARAPPALLHSFRGGKAHMPCASHTGAYTHQRGLKERQIFCQGHGRRPATLTHKHENRHTQTAFIPSCAG